MPVSAEKLLKESNRIGELPFSKPRDEPELTAELSDSGLAAMPDMPDDDCRCGGLAWVVSIGAGSWMLLRGSSACEYGGVGGFEPTRCSGLVPLLALFGEELPLVPDRGMAKVNADCLRETFSSCSRLRIARRFSFSTDELYDFASRSATFSSS